MSKYKENDIVKSKRTNGIYLIEYYYKEVDSYKVTCLRGIGFCGFLQRKVVDDFIKLSKRELVAELL